MAEFTIDDLLSTIADLRAGKDRPANLPPVARGTNPTAAFNRPYETGRATPPAMASSMDAETGVAPSTGTTKASAPDAEKQSAVQAWMAKNLPWLTGPLRAVGGAAQMPFRVGSDLARRGLHGAFGLEEQDPYKYSGKGAADILEALGDTAAPLKGGADSIREALIAGGARPTAPQAGAFGGNPAAKQVVEGVPAAGPVPAMPAMRGAPPCGATEGGAFVRAGGQPAMNGADTMPASEPTEGPKPKEGAFVAPQPAAKSLAEEFRKRSGEINRDPDGKLTPEQKAQAELNFFLGLMGRSSKRGVPGGTSFLGAFGDQGQESLKGITEMQDKNYARSRDKSMLARDDLYKEMGFADKDADNTRADKRADTEQKRWEATDRKDTERLRIMREQLEQGNWKVVNNGKTGTVTLVNTKDGSTKDTGVRIDRGDTRPAEVRLLEHLRTNPQDLETLLQLKGKDGPAKGDITEQGSFKAAMELLKGDITGKMEPADAAARVQKLIDAQRGGGTLPAGIPKGSKQVGTSGGKPVYESPDGKRFIVK